MGLRNFSVTFYSPYNHITRERVSAKVVIVTKPLKTRLSELSLNSHLPTPSTSTVKKKRDGIKMTEPRSTVTKGKKGEEEVPALNIKDSALASPGNDVPPPLGSGMMLSNVPTKAQRDAEKNPAPVKIEGQKSESSLRSDEDGVARGREINDTLMGRLLYLQWSFFAIIIEIILIYVLSMLVSKDGITVPIGGESFQQTVPVILELWMHLCYICTDFALSKSLAAYFGYQLSQKHGYSLIVCGFIQSGLFSKIQFSSLLNFRSKYKKVVSRSSLLWLVHILMLILTFFCSTAITISTTRYDSGSLLCIEYGQKGVPVDRGWPTMETEAGVAEFIFGSSLGILSSENGTPNTTLFTYPQLIDASADGTFIKGNGFATNLQTTCLCSPTNQEVDLEYAGVPSTYSTAMKTELLTLRSGQGVVQQLYNNATSGQIQVWSLVSGYRTCGGNNYANKSTLVCTTVVGSHTTASVSISWMNDGNNVRSAPKEVKNDDTFTGVNAKMDWLYAAMVNAQEGKALTTIKLTGFYPGTVSVLFAFKQHPTPFSYP